MTLTQGALSDAPRIADIHLAAFQHNDMLLAQFPTESVRRGLWSSVVDKTVAEMLDPQWRVMVVKDENQDLISFAKWCLPVPESVDYNEQPWEWPDGTNLDVLEKWTARVEAAGDEVLGTTPCYRMSVLNLCLLRYALTARPDFHCNRPETRTPRRCFVAGPMGSKSQSTRECPCCIGKHHERCALLREVGIPI